MYKEQRLIAPDDGVLSPTTALTSLGLEDRFLVFPMCQECSQIISHAAPKDSTCPECAAPTFISRYRSDEEGNITVDLNGFKMEILSQDDIEEVLDHWRLRNRRSGKFVDIMDGNVWKTLEAHDGTLFFDNDCSFKS